VIAVVAAETTERPDDAALTCAAAEVSLTLGHQDFHDLDVHHGGIVRL
jgi:hypothetical protein